MKLSLAVLATLAGAALAQEDDPDNGIKCTTTDAEDVPVDNDCEALWEGLIKDGDTKLDMPSKGEWYTAACSDTCKISVMPDEDGSRIENLYTGSAAQELHAQCGWDGEKDVNLPFKGEIKKPSPGRTTSVFKGGDC